MATIGRKVCTMCRKERSETAFPLLTARNEKRQYRGSRCKECVNEQVKDINRQKGIAAFRAGLLIRSDRNLLSEIEFLEQKVSLLREELRRRKWRL